MAVSRFRQHDHAEVAGARAGGSWAFDDEQVCRVRLLGVRASGGPGTRGSIGPHRRGSRSAPVEHLDVATANSPWPGVRAAGRFASDHTGGPS